MFQRALEAVASLVSQHGKAVLVVAGLITVGAAASILRLEADPSPRALLASADVEQVQIDEQFRSRFGSTDNIVALILEAERDVLSAPALGYMHSLGEGLGKLPHIERVESLARMPFRRTSSSSADEELTLDDLDQPKNDPQEDDPKLLGYMSDVVASAPELFPLGLASLSERLGNTKFEPLITSDKPSAEDALELKRAVRDTPVLRRKLIGRDDRFALVAVVFDDAVTEHKQLDQAVRGVRGFLSAHPPPAGIKIHVSGLPVVRTTMVEHMRRDQMVLTPGTLVVSLLLLVLAFRWWAGVVLPLVKVALTSLWVLGGMALFGIKLNVVTNILPGLLIIIGLSDSIHLVSRYLHEHGSTRDVRASLRTTIVAIGGACLGTSFTTAAGLFSLYVSKTRMLAEFGIVGGIGVLLSYVATLVFLPAMMRGLAPKREGAAEDLEEKAEHGRLGEALVELTRRILNRPGLVLAVSALLTAGAFLVARNVRVDSALLDQFDQDDPIYQTTKVLEQEFDGIRPLEVSLSSKEQGRFFDPHVLRALSDVGDWAKQQPGVLSTMDPSDHFEQAWAAMTGQAPSARDALRNRAQLEALAYVFQKRKPNPLSAFLTQDGKHARLRIRLTDAGSRATLSLVAALERQLAQKFGTFGDVTFRFTGDAYVSSKGLDAVVSDLTGSLGSAVLMILVIITLVFRSPRYAVLAIPPNVIPLVLAMAWMVIRDIPLNAATAIIFSVSIGMAVDGSIHMLSRFREELARRATLDEAILYAARGTGSALVIACTSLVLGFSVLLLSNFIPVQRFAELIAVSIASCLVATMLVLPAVLKAAGPRFVR